MTSRVRASILALAFAVSVALPTVAAAQETTEIGAKGGLNLAKLNFDGDNEDVSTLRGFLVGLWAAKKIKNTLGWRLEALLSQKGAKDANEDFKFKLTDIDVPLFLTVTPQSSGDTSFQFFAGPQVSLNTSAKFVFEGESTDAGDEVKSTSIAAAAGIAVRKKKLGAELRYTMGLSSIADEGDSVKHKVLAVLVSWAFR